MPAETLYRQVGRRYVPLTDTEALWYTGTSKPAPGVWLVAERPHGRSERLIAQRVADVPEAVSLAGPDRMVTGCTKHAV